jgi:hypothetical protein
MTKLLKRALILDAVAVPLMLLYWWLMGPHTVVQLSNCLVIGGGSLLIIGFLFYGGGRAALGDFTLQYARTVSAMDSAERQQQDWADQVKGYLDTVLFVLAGGIVCVMGILVHLMAA